MSFYLSSLAKLRTHSLWHYELKSPYQPTSTPRSHRAGAVRPRCTPAPVSPLPRLARVFINIPRGWLNTRKECQTSQSCLRYWLGRTSTIYIYRIYLHSAIQDKMQTMRDFACWYFITNDIYIYTRDVWVCVLMPMLKLQPRSRIMRQTRTRDGYIEVPLKIHIVVDACCLPADAHIFQDERFCVCVKSCGSPPPSDRWRSENTHQVWSMICECVCNQAFRWFAHTSFWTISHIMYLLLCKTAKKGKICNIRCSLCDILPKKIKS